MRSGSTGHPGDVRGRRVQLPARADRGGRARRRGGRRGRGGGLPGARRAGTAPRRRHEHRGQRGKHRGAAGLHPAHERRPGDRPGGPHRPGAARRGVGRAARRGRAARPDLRTRPVHPRPLHARRDDRQQLLRRAFGGLGQDRRQRAVPGRADLPRRADHRRRRRSPVPGRSRSGCVRCATSSRETSAPACRSSPAGCPATTWTQLLPGERVRPGEGAGRHRGQLRDGAGGHRRAGAVAGGAGAGRARLPRRVRSRGGRTGGARARAAGHRGDGLPADRRPARRRPARRQRRGRAARRPGLAVRGDRRGRRRRGGGSGQGGDRGSAPSSARVHRAGASSGRCGGSGRTAPGW